MIRILRGALALGLAALAAAVPARAETPARSVVAFVGDSMADGLWGAMFRRLGKDKCLADRVKLTRKAKNGTGLTRLDQFNWVDEIGKIVGLEVVGEPQGTCIAFRALHHRFDLTQSACGERLRLVVRE